jgi:ATP-dependent Clp protease ATP-binding subunit ClpX
MAKRNPGGGRNRTASCSFCRKSYRDVGPLVEGPGDVYICGECIELCQSIIDQEKRRRSGAPSPRRLSPEEIQQRLGRYVPGREAACGALAAAAFRHYQAGAEKKDSGTILLLGPSVASKLLLARALAHLLEVPFAHGDATAPLDANPTGPPPPGVLYQLLQAADFDLEAAQRGIVYLDGADRPPGSAPCWRRWCGGSLSRWAAASFLSARRASSSSAAGRSPDWRKSWPDAAGTPSSPSPLMTYSPSA